MIEDGLRESSDPCKTEKFGKILPVLVIALVIAEYLNVADGRHGRGMVGNKMP